MTEAIAQEQQKLMSTDDDNDNADYYSPLKKKKDKTTTNDIPSPSSSSSSPPRQRRRRHVKLPPTSADNADHNNNDHFISMLNSSSIEEKEIIARNGAITNPFVLLYLRLVAAIKIWFFYMIALESILGCLLTVGLTIFWYYDKQQYYIKDHPTDGTTSTAATWDGDMSFVLVTFAVVSPITVAIRIAFERRERALERIGDIRALLHNIYLIHSLWDWKNGTGRLTSKINYLDHADDVLEQIIAIGDELARFLSLPNMSLAIHKGTSVGRKEASQTVKAAYGLLESVTIQRMSRLMILSETLKNEGLKGSEISRCRSFERLLSSKMEHLRLLKMYRTPQALWSFARIFTIILPPFYAPTFANVAIQTSSLTTGIIFGIFTSLVLTALLESVQILEDPFTAFVSLDGIDVREEFQVLNWNQLIATRKLMFPNATEYPLRPKPALTGKKYDPKYHYHSTTEERELLVQRLNTTTATTHKKNNMNKNMDKMDTLNFDLEKGEEEEHHHHHQASTNNDDINSSYNITTGRNHASFLMDHMPSFTSNPSIQRNQSIITGNTNGTGNEEDGGRRQSTWT